MPVVSLCLPLPQPAAPRRRFAPLALAAAVCLGLGLAPSARLTSASMSADPNTDHHSAGMSRPGTSCTPPIASGCGLDV